MHIAQPDGFFSFFFFIVRIILQIWQVWTQNSQCIKLFVISVSSILTSCKKEALNILFQPCFLFQATSA